MMQNLNRKNSFEHYGAEPSPLVWEKIEKRLPVRSGKRRSWLIWSAAAILIGAIFFSAYWFDIEITLKKKGTAEKPIAAATEDGKKGIGKSSPQKNPLQITEHSEKNNNITQTEKSSSENIVSLPTQKKVSARQHTLLSTRQAITSVTQKITEENKSVPSEKSDVALNESNPAEKDFIKSILPIDITMIPVNNDAALALGESSINFQPLKKSSVSRWQWSVAAGENYNYRVLDFSSSAIVPISENEKNYLSEDERGIQTFAVETGIGYHLSTHFSLNLGINYFTAGQERSRSEVIFSNGTVGTPNTVYSVSTSAGTLSVNGQQVDFAYFNNADTSLFHATTNFTGSPAPSDSSTIQSFILRQEFSFVSLPLLIQYQTAEHRFTPYVGLGVSAGYIVKERVTVNDKKLDYNYRQSTNNVVFFAEAQAGVKYRINHKIFLKLQPSFRYGLNSLSGDDNIQWIPYSAGIGAGINIRF